jgi:hypothetical protein
MAMDEISIGIDEIVACLSPVGRYEFELATLRAQLRQRDEIIQALAASQHESAIGTTD